MNQNEDLKPLFQNEVEIESAVNLLLKEGYLLGSTDVQGISMTGKLVRFYKEKMSPQQPSTTAISSSKDSDVQITIQDFKEKAEIPFRIAANVGKANQFNYNVGQISKDAERYFNSKVVGKVNMEILISATKAYYKDSSTSRPTLTNYFLNGLWLDVYKNYRSKVHIQPSNESYTGERKL